VAALLLATLPARGTAAPPPVPAAGLPPITVPAGVDAAAARAAVAQAMRHAAGPVRSAVVTLVHDPQRPQDPPHLEVELLTP
jgi:hypothetical protein